MHPVRLTSEQSEVLRQVVAAVPALPIFATGEFEAAFGSTRDEVQQVIVSHPDWDLFDDASGGYDPSGDVVRAAFAWLFRGTPEEAEIMRSHITVSEATLIDTYAMLRELQIA